MLTHCAVALAHVLAVAPPVTANSPAAAGEARSSPSPEAERSEQAKNLYAEQRYLESAHAYEGLYAEFKAPKYLFNAAAAREAAGHDAHAYVLFRRFLETPGLSADDHERGEARMAPLRRRTAAIQLQLTPSPRPAGLMVTMTRDGLEPLQLGEDALQALDRQDVIEIWAETGEWSVQAQAPGFKETGAPVQASPGATRVLVLDLVPKDPDTRTLPPRQVKISISPPEALQQGVELVASCEEPAASRREQIVRSPVVWKLPVSPCRLFASSRGFRQGAHVLEAGQAESAVNLRLVPAEASPRRGTDKALVGLAASSGTLSLSGIVMSAVFGAKLADSLELGTERETQIDRWENPNRASWAQTRDAGLVLLGGGFGLAAGATVRRLSPPRQVKNWAGLAGAGLTFLAVGTALTISYTKEGLETFNSLSNIAREDRPDRQKDFAELEPIFSGRAAGAFFLGFGGGLIISAAVNGLCRDRCYGKARIAPTSNGMVIHF